MKRPEPFVLFRDFGASGLGFELRRFIGNITRQLQIASALRFKIDAAFRAANIEFPFQQRVVHMVPPEDGWAHFENPQDPQTSHPSTCCKSTLPGALLRNERPVLRFRNRGCVRLVREKNDVDHLAFDPRANRRKQGRHVFPPIQWPPRGSNTALCSSTTKAMSPPRRNMALIIGVNATVQA